MSDALDFAKVLYVFARNALSPHRLFVVLIVVLRPDCTQPQRRGSFIQDMGHLARGVGLGDAVDQSGKAMGHQLEPQPKEVARIIMPTASRGVTKNVVRNPDKP